MDYMKAAIVWVCLYLILFYVIIFEIQEKMFKINVNARPHCSLSSF